MSTGPEFKLRENRKQNYLHSPLNEDGYGHSDMVDMNVHPTGFDTRLPSDA